MLPGPYLNSDTACFAYTSLNQRWPAIIEGIAVDLEAAAKSASAASAAEAPQLVQAVRRLKQALADDELLGEIPAHLTNADEFNRAVPRDLRWHAAPWLLSECFLYRQLQAIFDESVHWQTYDMFLSRKNDTFVRSADAVSTLADRYHAISQQTTLDTKPEALEILFHELLSSALWGNATDLSLLTTVSLEELKRLQVAAEHRDQATLLANDTSRVWKQVSRQRGGRVDIVLDNSGFELYTDLVLALFLLDTRLAEQVVLHPKSQPWFVSDVVPADVGAVISLLTDTSKFPAHREAVDAVVRGLTRYMSEGELVIRSSPFWTTPHAFWEIKEHGLGGGDRVWRDLKQSKLVIFKGDLNYRKLTGDLVWPRTTPFAEAVQTLASSQVPFVTLRTVKADVCVGLAAGKAEALAAQWQSEHPNDNPEGWSWGGKYAVVNFLSGH